MFRCFCLLLYFYQIYVQLHLIFCYLLLLLFFTLDYFGKIELGQRRAVRFDDTFFSHDHGLFWGVLIYFNVIKRKVLALNGDYSWKGIHLKFWMNARSRTSGTAVVWWSWLFYISFIALLHASIDRWCGWTANSTYSRRYRPNCTEVTWIGRSLILRMSHRILRFRLNVFFEFRTHLCAVFSTKN